MQKQQRRWQYDWRRGVGERPTAENAELFHRYVEYAYQAIEEGADAAFPYHDVRQVCQPAYLFQVVADMRSDKLSMRIYQDESGLKLIVIHTVG